MPIALVKTDVAAAELNRPVSQILSLADGGSLREAGLLWVWNLARNPNASRRDLRFWRPELQALAHGRNQTVADLDLMEVIARILPSARSQFPAGIVDQLFQIRPRTRIDLAGELGGRLEGGRHYYQRVMLAAFLKRRWLGRMEATKK